MTSIDRFLALQSSYFIHCLDARVEFEKSVIWRDSPEGADHDQEACMQARDAGYVAFKIGINRDEVPLLLKLNNDLSLWWTNGWECAEEVEEMSVCYGCNDGTGNPCHTHG